MDWNIVLTTIGTVIAIMAGVAIPWIKSRDALTAWRATVDARLETGSNRMADSRRAHEEIQREIAGMRAEVAEISASLKVLCDRLTREKV